MVTSAPCPGARATALFSTTVSTQGARTLFTLDVDKVLGPRHSNRAHFTALRKVGPHRRREALCTHRTRQISKGRHDMRVNHVSSSSAAPAACATRTGGGPGEHGTAGQRRPSPSSPSPPRRSPSYAAPVRARGSSLPTPARPARLPSSCTYPAASPLPFSQRRQPCPRQRLTLGHDFAVLDKFDHDGLAHA